MKGQVSSDVEVKAPASAMWAAYKGLHLGRLVNKLLPDVLGTTEVVQGDGSVGTIVKMTFAPQVSAGIGGPNYMKEIYTFADNENRIKETEVIEGGFKELGFDLYRFRIEIVEKDGCTCIIRSTIIYELREEHVSNAALVSTQPLDIMATVVGNYVADEHNKQTTLPELASNSSAAAAASASASASASAAP